jgi:subtilisin family serine protease
MRTRAALLTAAVLVGAGLTATTQAAVPTGRYVVTVRDAASVDRVAGLTRALGGTIGFTYRDAIQGFSVTLPVPALSALRVLPGVTAVQADQVSRIAAAQPNPPYGLDRVDQRSLPLNHTFRYGGDGRYVTAYVVDTGIRRDVSDFQGRAVTGYDAVTAGGRADDCHGHGTHVSGTLGGATYGVAKRVRLVAVRVLGCDGSGETSQIVAGLDWIVRHHAAGQPAVANMSIEGPLDEAIDAAINRVIGDGVTMVVAAGNEGGLVTDLLGWDDSCTVSPAHVMNAITVAATDPDDSRASYSNRGTCVDLFAPGTDIVSDGIDGFADTEVMSGTSMASPHVAGAAALYLARNPRATPAQVTSAILSAATRGVVTGNGNAPNVLLFQAW